MPSEVKNPLRQWTGAYNPDTGKKIYWDCYPPGGIICTREERDKAPTLVWDAVNAHIAEYRRKKALNEGEKEIRPQPPVKIIEPRVPEMIHDLLTEHKKLHILKIKKALKDRGTKLERRVIQDFLDMMKDKKEVKQEDSFHYALQEAVNN